MPADHTQPTRRRILTEAMRLFGEQGYAATTIAQIEKAAGLSPGSGSLYRHFRSKHALLAEGVQQQIASGQQLLSLLDDQSALAHLPTHERVAVLARASLDRLERERDLNRLLLRDLDRFPDLVARMRDEEIQRMYHAATQWLAAQADPKGSKRDWPALAAVLAGAVSIYWLLCDVFGEHPAGIDQDRYIAALAELAAGLLDAGQDQATSAGKERP
jgi:AcrR family transcriptional regulator